jgi:hypothetical protein
MIPPEYSPARKAVLNASRQPSSPSFFATVVACVGKDGHHHADVSRQDGRQRTDDKRERGVEAGVEVPRGRGISASRVRHEEQDRQRKYCHQDEADLTVV